jgi:hypothetical protein
VPHHGGHLAGESRAGGLAFRSFLERHHRGQSLPLHLLSPKHRHHLGSQRLHGRSLPFLQREDSKLQGGESGVIRHLAPQEFLPYLLEPLPRPDPIAKPGGDPRLDPAQADVVEPAAMGCRERPHLCNQRLGLGKAAGLGEIVHEVVAQTEEEAGGSLPVDQGLRLSERGDGALRVSMLDEGIGLLDQSAAVEMGVSMFRISVEEDLRRLIEHPEGLGKPALRRSQRAL